MSSQRRREIHTNHLALKYHNTYAFTLHGQHSSDLIKVLNRTITIFWWQLRCRYIKHNSSRALLVSTLLKCPFVFSCLFPEPWSFFPPLFCPTAPNTTWLHIYFCLCLPTRISAPWEEDLCLGSPIAIVISSLVSFKPSDPICCISVLWASHCSFSLRGFHKFRAVLGIGELKLFLPMYSWNSHLPSHRPIPHCV